MSQEENRITNADFTAGKNSPRRWTWQGEGKQVRWSRSASDEAGESGGVTIESDDRHASAGWSQVVVCKPGEYYRIDATVSCDLTDVEEDDDTAGFFLSVQPIADGQPCGPLRSTPVLHRSTEPIDVRSYYQVPDTVRRLEIYVGLAHARGRVTIHGVRCLHILEPEEVSHVLSIPPLPFTVTAPRVVSTVCVCSDTASSRPITGLLGRYFGNQTIHAVERAAFRPRTLGSDALLLPDAVPPRFIRSVAALEKLAIDRIVIISLPAFAELSGDALSVRCVEQVDDPIHAKVRFAHYATRGFALADIFAYAWRGKQTTHFVQNHFRRTAALKAFCDKRGYEQVLMSVCCRDTTTDRPICLHKETSGGGLFVLDIDPVEAAGSNFAEPNLAMHLLLSMLGHAAPGLGQYIVPEPGEVRFRDVIRETNQRFPEFVVHDEDLPTSEITEQLVTIGREDESFGLPLTPKPLILVRSGLRSGDVESVYGAFQWFKQLIRMVPYRCCYADELASRFRLAWIPSAAAWEHRDGFRRAREEPAHPLVLETDGSPMAALIDVVSCPINQVRVIVPGEQRAYRRYVDWLPRVWEAFSPSRYYLYDVPQGRRFSDRDAYDWHRLSHALSVDVDDSVFREDAHRATLAAGGHVVRIEVPGYDTDFPACSIQRTDLTATLLEQVIGMQYGLIAVNRTQAPIRFDALSPVAPGEGLLLGSDDPLLSGKMARVG